MSVTARASTFLTQCMATNFTAKLLYWIDSFFFFKCLEDMSPFCGATDTPILDFWWHLLWVSKPKWVLPYSSLAEAYVIKHSLRFTSGVTPADLLAASMAVEPSLQHTCKALVDSKLGAIMPPLTVWDQADALPTELSRLGLLNRFFAATTLVTMHCVIKIYTDVVVLLLVDAPSERTWRKTNVLTDS